jgi:hypothetical protein
MSKKETIKTKNQAMEASTNNSLNSTTGYQDTGNDAQVQAGARMRAHVVKK